MNQLSLDIRSMYLNHLVGTFGADGMLMVHELPAFTAVRSTAGVLAVAPQGSESAKAKLEKALELYADQTGERVMFEGNLYTPYTLAMVA